MDVIETSARSVQSGWSITLSKASKEHADKFLQLFQLSEIDVTNDVIKEFAPQSAPERVFDPWPKKDRENVLKVPMINRLQEGLQARQVVIGQQGGYEVRDVTGFRSLLDGPLGPHHIYGTTDAIIVPFGTAQTETHMTQQLRAIIEFKKEGTDVKAPKTTAQVQLELLRAMAASNRPICAMATDMYSFANIFWVGVAGNETNKRVALLKAEGLTIDIAVAWLANYLQVRCTPSFDELRALDPLLRDFLPLLDESRALLRPPSSYHEQLEVLEDLPITDRLQAFAQLSYQHMVSSAAPFGMYS